MSLSGCAGFEVGTEASAQREGAGSRDYEVEILVRGSALHGIHGIDFDPSGRLFVGSVLGESIYEIDRESGAPKLVVPPPMGTADDLAFGPPGSGLDGHLVWTHIREGEIWAMAPGGRPRAIVRDVPAANALAFDAQGRLFVSQTFGPDLLVEVDPFGRRPHRLVASKLGNLNGFDFGPDRALYGPRFFRGEVIRVDVESGDVEVVADGFGSIAAVNFDSQGRLYVADTTSGELTRIDLEAGTREVVTRIAPAIDNLAIDANDHVWLTVMAENAVYRVDPAEGSVDRVHASPLAVAGDVEVVAEDGVEWLYIADLFRLVRMDTATGRLQEVARSFASDLQFPTHLDISDALIALSSSFVNSVQVLRRDDLETLYVAEHLDAPQDVLIEPEGGVLVIESGTGRLLRLVGPAASQRSVLAEGFDKPCDLIRGPGQEVLISETGGGRVLSVDLVSGRSTVVLAGLDQPEGLSLDGHGGLWVAEAGARSLRRYDLEGQAWTSSIDDLPIGFLSEGGGGPLPVASSIAISPGGGLYLSADRNASIYRVTRSLQP